MTRKPTPSGKSCQRQSRIVGRVTALPEIEASGEADCPPDSIKIVRSIRALISVASYSYVSDSGEVGKDGNATWPWREFMSAMQKNSRPPGGESYSWLVSTTIHERAFAPSMNKQPVLPLFRALSFVTPSLPPSFSLCPSVHLFLASGHPIFLSLFSPRSQRERESEKTLLIYDKTEDPDYPVIRFSRQDLRNLSRRKGKMKGGQKERSAMSKYAIMLARNPRGRRRSNSSQVARIKNQVPLFLSSSRSRNDVVVIFRRLATRDTSSRQDLF